MKRTLIICLFLLGIVFIRVLGQTAEFTDQTLTSSAYNTHIPIAFLGYSSSGAPVWNPRPAWELNKAYPVSIFMKASPRSKAFELVFLNYDVQRAYTLVFRSNFSKEPDGLRTFSVRVKPGRGAGNPFKRVLKFPMRIAWGDVSQELRKGIDPRQWARTKTPFSITFLSVRSDSETIFYQ